VPIIKTTQEHKYNTKTAEIHKTITIQTNKKKQTNKRNQYYRKRYVKYWIKTPIL
jgi:hypothetical protein